MNKKVLKDRQIGRQTKSIVDRQRTVNRLAEQIDRQKTDGEKDRQTASIGKTDRQETVLYTKDGSDKSREKPW